MPEKAPRGRRDVVTPLRRTPKYEVMLPQIVEMAEAGAGIDLISRALGIGAEVVRNALHLHQTGLLTAFHATVRTAREEQFPGRSAPTRKIRP